MDKCLNCENKKMFQAPPEFISFHCWEEWEWGILKNSTRTYTFLIFLFIIIHHSFQSMYIYPSLVFHSFILPIAHCSYIDSWKKQAWNLRWPFVKFLVLCRLLYCNLSHTLWTLYHIYLVALNFSIILWEFCPWYVLDFPQYWSPLEVHLKAI